MAKFYNHETQSNVPSVYPKVSHICIANVTKIKPIRHKRRSGHMQKLIVSQDKDIKFYGKMTYLTKSVYIQYGIIAIVICGAM